ncbi:MAG: ATP synthase F0 subunit C [Candidatus Coatesbacteria bacterium]|nr:ATP synthase F0 subunit C [Candidatus Coatesbacteria bacterium]
MDAFWAEAIKYLAAGICMGFGAIGAGIGEGFAAGQTALGISRQPKASGQLVKTMLIGQAITETSGIFALVIAVLMISTNVGTEGDAIINMAAMLGAGIAVGIAGFGVAIGVGYCAGRTCDGVARRPNISSQITGTMLVGQAVAETPVIFALVVAFILLYSGFTGGLEKAFGLVSAGIAMGFGAFGSGIGGGLPGGAACSSVARREEVRGQVLGMMLVGQAVTQTSAIFALVVAFLLIFVQGSGASIVKIAAYLGAGFSMGLGAIGAGVGTGMPAASACTAIRINERTSSLVMRVMLIGQAVAQSPAIASLIVALFLLFVV